MKVKGYVQGTKTERRRRAAGTEGGREAGSEERPLGVR
jgi:hypothetical protein